MTITAPPLPVIAMNRLAFGPRPGDVDALARRGLASWVDEQLRPEEAADRDCRARLDAAKLRIRYGASPDWGLTDELRPLSMLDAPTASLWHLADNKQKMAGPERQRPRSEVAAATLIRAVHSHWQLREVLVDFWHNHFNVYALEPNVAVGLPAYDRDVIRAHCLGNFRAFLEAVATSSAMQVFLNNRSSRAGSANENYGRELLELHTLGAPHYLNALYNRWREVPGAAQGKAAGYIDQDVYEAARAFTGWTLADGKDLGGGQKLPDTGAFQYAESWHDNYQKRVLGVEFDPFQAPMADGRRVLDLVAAHPGTAMFVCAKLVRRLVGDPVPEALVKEAAQVWTANRTRDDQIARVVRVIALSPIFARTWGDRVKRPLEVAASFARATDIEMTASEGVLGEMDAAGQRLFGWAPPTGHPDDTEYWLSSAVMRRRWSIVLGLAEGWWGTAPLQPGRAMGGGSITAERAVAYWLPRVVGSHAPPETGAVILAAMKIAPDAVINNAPPGKDPEPQLRRLVAYCAMTPEFHYR
ncbi:MAG: DUF1800 domain-containing protein [Azospirillaceae bacterium]|nr:DUF1800 domain-containing protein [Azospirillaceae bacterium]